MSACLYCKQALGLREPYYPVRTVHTDTQGRKRHQDVGKCCEGCETAGKQCLFTLDEWQAMQDRERAELEHLKARERLCPTMQEAESRALLRAMQEIGAALGLKDPSPAQVVAGVEQQLNLAKGRAAAAEREGSTLRAEIQRLQRKLARAAASPAWISVTDGVPEPRQVVCACYRNEAGELCQIRAEFVAPKSRRAEDFDDLGEVDFDEATGLGYWPAGWYECIDNWGDYSRVQVCEGEVIAWVALPALPADIEALGAEGVRHAG